MNGHISSKCITLLISFVVVLCASMPARAENAYISEPRRGDTIQNRRDFTVTVQIDGFDVSAYYWVAIASVKEHSETWDRILTLYDSLKKKPNDALRGEMLKLMDKWQIDLFWPKYYVSTKLHEGRVFDGGSNPLHGLEPQPMILIVLKIDDTLQAFLRKWLRDSAAGKGYPGISASKLNKSMILARCEIFFP